MKLQKIFVIAAVLLLAGTLAFAGCVDSDKVAKDGDTVSVYYTLSVNSTEMESNFDSTPLSFKIGSGQMISGFNDGIIGMKIGETKTITVPPEKGYGIYSKDKIITEKLSEIEAQLGTPVSVGDRLIMYVNSVPLSGTVHSINRNNDTVLIDFNHHLAGETLTFTVKLLEIN